jgi:hypothetical protein
VRGGQGREKLNNVRLEGSGMSFDLPWFWTSDWPNSISWISLPIREETLKMRAQNLRCAKSSIECQESGNWQAL